MLSHAYTLPPLCSFEPPRFNASVCQCTAPCLRTSMLSSLHASTHPRLRDSAPPRLHEIAHFWSSVLRRSPDSTPLLPSLPALPAISALPPITTLFTLPAPPALPVLFAYLTPIAPTPLHCNDYPTQVACVHCVPRDILDSCPSRFCAHRTVCLFTGTVHAHQAHRIFALISTLAPIFYTLSSLPRAHEFMLPGSRVFRAAVPLLTIQIWCYK